MIETRLKELLDPVCPTCGYALVGLPAEGVCPECGHPYDDSAIVLHGWACGSHADSGNARRAWLPMVAILPYFYWLLARYQSVKSLAIWLGIGVLAMLPAWLRRNTTDHPGGIQIRMSDRGIVQIDNLKKLRESGQIPAGFEIPWQRLRFDQWYFQQELLRIKARYEKPFYKPTGWPIDAELKCSKELADELKKQVRAWGAKMRP